MRSFLRRNVRIALVAVCVLAMVVGLMPGMKVKAENGTIKYIENGVVKTYMGDYTLITPETTAWTSGWYVVSDRCYISSRIICTGIVNLVLYDGCTLNAYYGITVSTGNTLNIYTGLPDNGDIDGSGSLNVNAGNTPPSCAGIGGDGGNSCGTVNIYGGTVTATAGAHAAGIGGGNGGNGGSVSIYGGAVTANGRSYGAGIGGGDNGDGGTVNIYGGTVTANGSLNAAGIGGGQEGNGGTVNIYDGTVVAGGDNFGAGIGGGQQGNGGTVNIYDGTVTATGGENAAGIGGGADGDGETVNIYGGTVTATGGENAAGIGGGFLHKGAEVTIEGGFVTAIGGEGSVGIGCGEGPASDGSLTIADKMFLCGDDSDITDTTSRIVADYSGNYARKKYMNAMESYTATFKVRNGSWDNGGNTDKKIALTRRLKTDTPTLEAGDIPAVGSNPASRYMAGGWDVAPTAGTFTADKTYTYTYVPDPNAPAPSVHDIPYIPPYEEPIEEPEPEPEPEPEAKTYDLKLKATSKNGKITLKWAKAEGAEKYRIYQYIRPVKKKVNGETVIVKEGRYKLVKEVTGNRLTLKKALTRTSKKKALKRGSTYRYKIKVCIEGSWKNKTENNKVSVKVK